MLRLGNDGTLPQIARVERLPADRAVDEVLRFIFDRAQSVRPAFVTGSGVVGPDPLHLIGGQFGWATFHTARYALLWRGTFAAARMLAPMVLDAGSRDGSIVAGRRISSSLMNSR